VADGGLESELFSKLEDEGFVGVGGFSAEAMVEVGEDEAAVAGVCAMNCV
jgi:hypothetical protein